MTVDHFHSIEQLAAGFRFDLPQESRAVYCRVLGEYRADVVRAAVTYLLRNAKRFPSIAELLDVIEAGHGRTESDGESPDAALARKMYAALGHERASASTDAELIDEFRDDLAAAYPGHRSMASAGALGFFRSLVDAESNARKGAPPPS